MIDKTGYVKMEKKSHEKQSLAPSLRSLLTSKKNHQKRTCPDQTDDDLIYFNDLDIFNLNLLLCFLAYKKGLNKNYDLNPAES